MKSDQKTMSDRLRQVFKRLHYLVDIILTCLRWYVACPLSLRHLEEMFSKRGVPADHSTIHRWALKLLPVITAICRRRKRPVGKSWRTDETYVKVGGQWKYLYRAVDKNGDTVDFLLRAHRDQAAARTFFERATGRTIFLKRSSSTEAVRIPRRLPACRQMPTQASLCSSQST